MTMAAIASRLRSAYAWVLFTLILMPLMPVAFCLSRVSSSPARRNAHRAFVARWLSVYARRSPLYRFDIEGRANLPSDGSYILVANHESGLDVLCLFLLGSPVRILSADWVTRIPVVGLLFRWSDHIAMDPGSRESRAAARREVVASLRAGSPVAIFPEGRIPEPGEGLVQFRTGAFAAALETGAPLVPVVLAGTGKAWAPRTAVVEGRHTVRIRILPRLHAENSHTPARLADAVHARMEEVAASLR